MDGVEDPGAAVVLDVADEGVALLLFDLLFWGDLTAVDAACAVRGGKPLSRAADGVEVWGVATLEVDFV